MRRVVAKVERPAAKVVRDVARAAPVAATTDRAAPKVPRSVMDRPLAPIERSVHHVVPSTESQVRRALNDQPADLGPIARRAAPGHRVPSVRPVPHSHP